jgi:hypothetical protein
VALLAMMAGAIGCASTRATVKQYGTDSAMQLADPAAWTRYEVRRHSFRNRVEFRDLASGRAWVMKFKGRPISWMTPVNILVPPKIYEERSHRGNFRFEHPISHAPVVLRARARSRTLGTVPLPAEAAPTIEILDGKEQQVQGRLAYDLHSLTVFSGELAGHQVEIVQQNEGARRPHNPLQELATPFPFAGEFVVRLDGQDAARFLKRVPRGTVASYDLALRADGSPEERDAAALAFTVFVLMEEFIGSSVS